MWTNNVWVVWEQATEVSRRIVEMPITFLEREAGQSKLSGGIFTEELCLVTKWGQAKRGGQLAEAVHGLGERIRRAQASRRRGLRPSNRRRP